MRERESLGRGEEKGQGKRAEGQTHREGEGESDEEREERLRREKGGLAEGRKLKGKRTGQKRHTEREGGRWIEEKIGWLRVRRG